VQVRKACIAGISRLGRDSSSTPADLEGSPLY
jgi:hypothetical protein